jgi:hypothetical protein
LTSLLTIAALIVLAFLVAFIVALATKLGNQAAGSDVKTAAISAAGSFFGVLIGASVAAGVAIVLYRLRVRFDAGQAVRGENERSNAARLDREERQRQALLERERVDRRDHLADLQRRCEVMYLRLRTAEQLASEARLSAVPREQGGAEAAMYEAAALFTFDAKDQAIRTALDVIVHRIEAYGQAVQAMTMYPTDALSKDPVDATRSKLLGALAEVRRAVDARKLAVEALTDGAATPSDR